METIGDLERTPRAPLALRFGPVLTRSLDQANGHIAETFEPITEPELVSVRNAFFEPIGAPETLQRKTAELLGRLCSELEGRGRLDQPAVAHDTVRAAVAEASRQE